jgi:predicted Zn-dependent protease
MTPRNFCLVIGCAVLMAGLACNDSSAPDLPAPYEWRLFLPDTSAGPAVDTLSFHWPQSSRPIKIWIEAQYAVPARIQEGIILWRHVFRFGEWDATVVADSSIADVIVRTVQLSATISGSARLRTGFTSCEGVTVIDTVATRFQLRVPVRMFVYPLKPTAGDLDSCLHTVATHELGHALGIFQHSPDPQDIMYANPSVAQPSDRDASTATEVYRSPANMVPVRP